MQQSEVIKVDPNTETICCDGDEDSLGHPAVYFTFGSQNTIVCNYCGKTFIKKKKDKINVQKKLGIKKNMPV
jgi:uncharacterized Zn-finger protein